MDLFRGAPQPSPVADDNDRALDQTRVTDHGLDDPLFEGVGSQAQFAVLGFATADKLMGCDAQHGDDTLELISIGWGLEVLDDLGLDAPIPDQVQGLARLGAAWIMVDGDSHE